MKGWRKEKKRGEERRGEGWRRGKEGDGEEERRGRDGWMIERRG